MTSDRRPSAKRILSALVLLVCSAPLHASQHRVIPLAARDIAWDGVTKLIYATVPSSAGRIGNSIVAIDPFTGVIRSSAFVGSEPTRLAAAGDGRTLWVYLAGSETVRRFDLATQTPGLEFSLARPGEAFLRLSDMKVIPGSSDAVIIARSGTIPPASPQTLISVYDNGVRRPNEFIAQGSNLFDALEFSGSDDTLFGLEAINRQTLRKFSVDALGIKSGAAIITPILGNSIKYDSGLIYGNSGQVIDPVTLQVKGKYDIGSSYGGVFIVPASDLGRTFFITPFSSVSSRLITYDLNTFVPLSSEELKGTHDTASTLIRWGSDGLAFITKSELVLIRTSVGADYFPQIVFPQFALGGGFEVVLNLTNKSAAPWRGKIRALQGNAEPWVSPLQFEGVTPAGAGEFEVNLQARGFQRVVFKGDSVARAGYLEIAQGDKSAASDLVATFFYNFRINGVLADSVGVQAAKLGARFVVPVERDAAVNTGLAWVNLRTVSEFTLALTLLDQEGNVLERKQVMASGQTARLLSEIFETLPENFTGSVKLQGSSDFYIVAFRLEGVGGRVQLTSVSPAPYW
ncbi:MAG TPA: hypothetical protein VGK99_13755 [Acidobacteriota bacterium]